MGPINMTRAFLPALKASREHLVNFSSRAGRVGTPGYGAYAVSKFGPVGLPEVRRGELAAHGIEVTVACPGYAWTPIHDPAQRKGYDRAKVAKALRILSPIWFTAPEKLVPKVAAAIKKENPCWSTLSTFCSASSAYDVKSLSPWLRRKAIHQDCRMETGWKG